MPRETIPTYLDTDTEPYELSVGWARDLDMQIGIEGRDDGSGREHLVDYVYGDEASTIGAAVWKALADGDYLKPLDFPTSMAEVEHMDGIGRIILDAVTGSTPFGTGVWWTPDRTQVNQLIRLLRKARDSAYGADA